MTQTRADTVSDVTEYTYNSLDLANRINYNDAKEVTYQYNTGNAAQYTRATLDTLVKEEVGGNTDRWLYGLQSLQVKITSEGTDWWGQQTQQDVLTAYTHHDRLGSIVNLTDQYGRNLVRADYREYGEIAFYDSITVNGGYRRIAPQLVYTNHEWDDVLKLYYAKARFYDPDEKRFLSTDPVKGTVIDPLSLVPYLYCVDNPLRWTDPLGMIYTAVIRDSTGEILRTIDLMDLRYAETGYYRIEEIIPKINNKHVKFDRIITDETITIKVYEVNPQTKYYEETFVFGMDTDVLKNTTGYPVPGVFARNNAFYDYGRTYGTQPRVYFKGFYCLGMGNPKYYVNIFDLAALSGLNVQIIKHDNFSTTQYVDNLLNIANATYDYTKVAVKQVLLGNYADEVNWLGTIGEVGVGLTGLDVATDFRDVIYDLQYWEWTWKNAGKLALDSVGLVPVVGIIKNSDEVALVIKKGDDVTGSAIILGKHANDAVAAAKRLMPDLGKLSKALDYGIDTYDNLRKAKKGVAGLEAHHIIEIRLAKNILGIDNTDKMLSVVLTHAEHRMFTSKWAELIPYGSDYSKYTADTLWKYAQEVYRNYPTLLEIARQTIFGS